MGNNPALNKGDKLEEIVEFIERTIIGVNPNFKGAKLEITRKKIIIADGVRHEIDLYVEIDSGNEYKSVFIFECKNWDGNVDKNQIIIFSEKIKISNAQNGFFIAKGYTKDAIEQSKKDKRIKILNVIDNNLDFSPFPSINMFIYLNVRIIEVNLYCFGVKKDSEIKKLALNSETNIIYKNEKKKLLDFINAVLIPQIYDEQEKKNISPGEYEYDSEKEFLFNHQEFFLDVEELKEKDIEKIYLKIKFKLIISKPKVISRIDIGGRGCFIEYEPIKSQDKEFKIEGAFITTTIPIQ